MSLSADDRFEIVDLLSRCAYAYDERKLDLLESCYTEDAVFGLTIKGGDAIEPFEGREAIMGLYRGSMDAQSDQRRHVISNLCFEQTGEEPVVLSYLSLFATDNAQARLLCTGLYRDTLRRTDKGWKLQHRDLDLDGPH